MCSLFINISKGVDTRRTDELFKLKTDAVSRTDGNRLALNTFPLEMMTSFLVERAENFW